MPPSFDNVASEVSLGSPKGSKSDNRREISRVAPIKIAQTEKMYKMPPDVVARSAQSNGSNSKTRPTTGIRRAASLNRRRR